MTFLVHFMKEATEELLWMSQKEETEVSRDWSDSDLELEDIQEYRKVSDYLFLYVLISYFLFLNNLLVLQNFTIAQKAETFF